MLRQRGLVLLVALAATAYFAHHALHGRFGLETRRALAERMVVARGKLAGLEAARAELARDVALLGAERPDPDLVIELARTTLGFGFPEERVLIPSRPSADR